MHRLIAVAVLLGSIVGVAAQSAASDCIGDCNGDSEVTVDELITGVNIALGSQPLSDCEVMDEDGSGAVEVNELVTAVNAALCGCGHACPTPLPTRTVTASPTPTRTLPPSPTVTPTRSPIPSPTSPSGCVRVQQGLWCFEFGDPVVRGDEDPLTQSGCTLTFADASFSGPISGNRWQVRSDEFDVTVGCVFSGNPATSCSGTGTVQGITVPVHGMVGGCD
jgi:hypothetical protein